MLFGQLCNCESLRDLIITISAHPSKYYHLGLGENVSRSNLANANEHRDYRIYQAFAYEMIALVPIYRDCNDSDFLLDIKGNVYAFDSTTIDLCLSVFWWATFRTTKAAIKLHTQLDVKTAIPVFVHITEASVHDVNAMDELIYEVDGYYIFDKGYIDFERLFFIHQSRASFVTRAKNNLQFERIYAAKVDKTKGIMCDQTIRLKRKQARKDYPEKWRRIKFFDAEKQRIFIFLTNNFCLPPLDIAMLYKERWKIELFFKWIKQHLKIKSFLGNIRQRCKNTSVCCNHRLLLGCNHKSETQNQANQLRNIIPMYREVLHFLTKPS